MPQSSPDRIAQNTDTAGEENDDVETRDNRGTSPPRVGNWEMLAWGRGGVHIQTMHGNSSGANRRFIKGRCMTKLVKYIRNLEEKGNEFDVHLTRFTMDEQSMPTLQRLYICCLPSLSIRHLCQDLCMQFIASHINVKDKVVELLAMKPYNGRSELKSSASMAKAECEPEL